MCNQDRWSRLFTRVLSRVRRFNIPCFKISFDQKFGKCDNKWSIKLPLENKTKSKFDKQPHVPSSTELFTLTPKQKMYTFFISPSFLGL